MTTETVYYILNSSYMQASMSEKRLLSLLGIFPT